MNWFKKLFCKHEVNLNNLEEPICRFCEKKIDRLILTETSMGVNPLLKRWYIKKNLSKYAEVFKVIGKK